MLRQIPRCFGGEWLVSSGDDGTVPPHCFVGRLVQRISGVEETRFQPFGDTTDWGSFLTFGIARGRDLDDVATLNREGFLGCVLLFVRRGGRGGRGSGGGNGGSQFTKRFHSNNVERGTKVTLLFLAPSLFPLPVPLMF